MKKLLLTAMLLAGLVITQGCQKDEPETAKNPEETTESANGWLDSITISFARPYTQEPMKTRADVGIGEAVSHLDCWIISGTDTITINQTKAANNDFGTITAVLDRRREYRLIAVGHKATSASLSTEGIISFADDKLSHSMYYSHTFKPDTLQSLSARMERIVAGFRLQTTDVVPAEAKKLRTTFSGIYNRWSTEGEGAPTNLTNHQNLIQITSTLADGTASFTSYAIVPADETTHTILVEVLDSSDQVIQSRTFNAVKLRRGWLTVYRGELFTDQSAQGSFTIGDWNEYDVVDF